MNKAVIALNKLKTKERRYIALLGTVLIVFLFYYAAIDSLLSSVSRLQQTSVQLNKDIDSLTKMTHANGQKKKDPLVQKNANLLAQEKAVIQDVDPVVILENIMRDREITFTSQRLSVSLQKSYYKPLYLVQAELFAEANFMMAMQFVHNIHKEFNYISTVRVSYHHGNHLGTMRITLQWYMSTSPPEGA